MSDEQEQEVDDGFADTAILHLAKAAIAAFDKTQDERLKRIESAIINEMTDIRTLLKSIPNGTEEPPPDPQQQAWNEMRQRSAQNTATMDQMQIELMKKLMGNTNG